MKRYGVTMTTTLNGYVVVEAESADAAMDLVENDMGKYATSDRFDLGEVTADYADETDDECTDLTETADCHYCEDWRAFFVDREAPLTYCPDCGQLILKRS